MTDGRSPYPNRWLLVSDLDDTLLNDQTALMELTAALRRVRRRVLVAFNSSRPCASQRHSIREQPHLPPADYLIGAMGTEIEHGPSGVPLPEYGRSLGDGWRREAIAALMRRLGFAAHPDEYQTRFKASYTVPGDEACRLVRDELARHGHAAKVVHSGGTHLDILPVLGGKGRAVDHLRERLGLPRERVVVAGDSGNDRDMFVPPFRGIVVGNASPELKALSGEHVYHARRSRAAGVLEGLRHWGVLPAPAETGAGRGDGPS